MTNIKKFEDFVKESTENRGKGVDGDTDLFSRPTAKQTINKGDLNPIDNLGIRGRQITTENIDGIVKNVTGGEVYVEDRLSKEIKKYTVSNFLKEFHKAYKKDKKESEKTNESIVIEEVKLPELKDDDKELLNKILNVNESDKKEIWEKKWESFASNYVKATKEIDEDVDEEPINESIENENNEESSKSIKVEKFADFLKNRVKIRPDTIDEDINLENDQEDIVIENSVPKPLKTVKCNDCSDSVTDNDLDKSRHLYSKHNFKPTTDDLDNWLLEYFPPNVPEKKKK